MTPLACALLPMFWLHACAPTNQRASTRIAGSVLVTHIRPDQRDTILKIQLPIDQPRARFGLRPVDEGITALAVNITGTLCAIIDASPTDDRAVHIYDTRTPVPVRIGTVRAGAGASCCALVRLGARDWCVVGTRRETPELAFIPIESVTARERGLSARTLGRPISIRLEGVGVPRRLSVRRTPAGTLLLALADDSSGVSFWSVRPGTTGVQVARLGEPLTLDRPIEDMSFVGPSTRPVLALILHAPSAPDPLSPDPGTRAWKIVLVKPPSVNRDTGPVRLVEGPRVVSRSEPMQAFTVLLARPPARQPADLPIGIVRSGPPERPDGAVLDLFVRAEGSLVPEVSVPIDGVPVACAWDVAGAAIVVSRYPTPDPARTRGEIVRIGVRGTTITPPERSVNIGDEPGPVLLIR